MGCTETFPKKVDLWLHIEDVHTPVDSQKSAKSPGTNSAMPADSGIQAKKTYRFHCKEKGCTETFPKKAALVQHMKANHTEKSASPVTDKNSIQKFKMAVKEALAHTLPQKHREEMRVGKGSAESGGSNYYPQEASDKVSQASTGKDKSDDISCQGQVVMMVWAGDDGEEVVTSKRTPGSSAESG